MANYGLSKPVIAKLDVATGNYSNGFMCGKAVNTAVNPQYAEAKLYGDNELCEEVKEFKYADVTLGTTTMPIAAAGVMFGHEVSEEDKEVTYKVDDSANYVGYGFIVAEQEYGAKTYGATWLPKVKFADPSVEYTTKGDSIEFKTPSFSGTAAPNADGVWKETKQFETEAAAVAWLKGKANIQEQAVG